MAKETQETKENDMTESLATINIKEIAKFLQDSGVSMAQIIEIALLDDQYTDDELVNIFDNEYNIEPMRVLGAALEDAKLFELEDVAEIFTEDEWF